MGIVATARRRFDSPPAIADRPGHADHLRSYLTDLVAPFGLELREQEATDRVGHSYGEMAEALLPELAPPDQPVDLLVLAFANPDVRPGRASATYLSERCPGHPMAFAVSDQGSAAGFTGLRLITEYARTGAVRRALLLVVEQAAVPYDAGVPVDLPTGHAAVGLRCEFAAPAAVTEIRQHPGVPEDRVAPLLAEELSRLAPATTLLVDDQLAGRLAAAPPVAPERLVAGPPGQPHTGVWWELAGRLATDRRPGRLVMAGYERRLGYLSLSAVDLGTTQ